jgi:hypothetical protein
MMGSIIAGILIIIALLALLGLGWDTFVSGVKKGADKVGITPIVQGAVEIVENGTKNIVSNLRQYIQFIHLNIKSSSYTNPHVRNHE